MKDSTGSYSWVQLIGLVGGPALFVLTRLFVSSNGLSPAGNAVLATTLWIATWWITEAIPIPATSLLPIVLFPALGVSSVVEATAPYADPIVFLFLGGFLVALAIERWDLHRRIALVVLVRIGSTTRGLILGFMIVTAFLSMWVSNTATAMMMVPIGMAVIAQVEALHPDEDVTDPSYSRPVLETLEDEGPPQSNFGVALMLAIAYSASIGGIATLIGTPPNAIFAGVARNALGLQIGFFQWMLYGVPLSVVFLGVTWLVLITTLRPETRTVEGSETVFRRQLDSLGSMSRGERRVTVVFALLVVGWLTRPFLIEPVFPGITDTTIALVCGLLVFLVPVDLERGEFLLTWEETTRIPWGVLVLFGAGFSIARAFRSSGLDQWIASGMFGFTGISFALFLLVVATVVVFLTEVTSNSATASLFIPVVASFGAALSGSPLVLMVVVSTATSFAFMLPVATPPNAIVFGSGYLRISQMARTGFLVNLLGIVFLTLMAYLWLPIVWGL